MKKNIVKVTGKKSGKAVKKTLKATITVKNPALSVKAADIVAVGATEQITATVKPANTKITYTSDNTDVATVDEKGLVTGVKAGDVTITVKAGKTTKTVKMAVKDVILKDVKQTTTTKLVATVAGNTANVKASDIVITNTYSKANFAVKSVSVDSKDKTQVTVETYVAMNDGKDYTVTLADVTKTITATDGKIVAATISPATVIVPTPAPDNNGKTANDVSAKFTDANGVEIATVDANVTSLDGFAYVEWKVDATNNGYLSGKTLNLYKVGNTAKVTVIAHTGKYNASAVEEGNVTAETTITGVAPETVTTTGWSVKLGTTADKKSTTEFKNVKEAKVAVKDTGVVAYIQRTESNGKTADASTGYTFESSDIDVMTVGTAEKIKDATAIPVTPYKAGNAYIIVKDAKTKAVVTTLPVTVVAERKVTAVTLDKSAFTLSSAAGIDPSVTVKVSAKDQYGEDVAVEAGVTCKNANSKIDHSDLISISKNEITVKNPGLTDKHEDSSNTYIVEYKDVKVTFAIVVKKAGDKATTYDMSLSADKVDAVIKADATKNTTVTASVCGYDANGVKVSVVSDAAVTWTLQKDGKDAKDAKGVTTGSSITINDRTSGKQMAAGVYTLKASYDNKVFVKTFEVTNSQPAASASLKDTAVTSGSTLKSNLKVVYDGNELATAKYKITAVNGTTASDEYAITSATNIAKVTVKIELTDNVFVEKELEIGKTIITK